MLNGYLDVVTTLKFFSEKKKYVCIGIELETEEFNFGYSYIEISDVNVCRCGPFICVFYEQNA